MEKGEKFYKVMTSSTTLNILKYVPVSIIFFFKNLSIALSKIQYLSKDLDLSSH